MTIHPNQVSVFCSSHYRWLATGHARPGGAQTVALAAHVTVKTKQMIWICLCNTAVLKQRQTYTSVKANSDLSALSDLNVTSGERWHVRDCDMNSCLQAPPVSHISLVHTGMDCEVLLRLYHPSVMSHQLTLRSSSANNLSVTYKSSRPSHTVGLELSRRASKELTWARLKMWWASV